MALRVDPVQMAHQVGLRAMGSRNECKIQDGLHTMPRDRARALSRRGTRTLTELANDYAFTYAPYIQAAVRRSATTTARSRSGSRGSESRLNVMGGGPRKA